MNKIDNIFTNRLTTWSREEVIREFNKLISNWIDELPLKSLYIDTSKAKKELKESWKKFVEGEK